MRIPKIVSAEACQCYQHRMDRAHRIPAGGAWRSYRLGRFNGINQCEPYTLHEDEEIGPMAVLCGNPYRPLMPFNWPMIRVGDPAPTEAFDGPWGKSDGADE